LAILNDVQFITGPLFATAAYFFILIYKGLTRSVQNEEV